MMSFETNRNGNNNHDNDGEKSVAAALLIAVVAITGAIWAIFLLTCLRAWVIATLWGWYLVPAFGVPGLSLPVAFGISLITGYLIRNEDRGWKERIASGLMMPFMVLFLGWVGTLFM
jgi:hypothetical protein